MTLTIIGSLIDMKNLALLCRAARLHAQMAFLVVDDKEAAARFRAAYGYENLEWDCVQAELLLEDFANGISVNENEMLQALLAVSIFSQTVMAEDFPIATEDLVYQDFLAAVRTLTERLNDRFTLQLLQ